MSARCGSCGEPIIWATTHAGRNMPLDARPSPEPTNLRAWRDPSGTLQVRDSDGIGSTEAPPDAQYATSHFATCPNADAHRKKRRREPVTCKTADVNGTTVLVRGQGELTQADLDALNEVVAAAKRKYEAEDEHRG